MGPRRKLAAFALVLTVAGAGSLAPTAGAASDPGYDVVIRRATHGIPHILARDYKSLGYGYAYAFAQDNICTIADSYVTVSAQRSRFFGPDRTWRFEGNGATQNNLNSDFYYQRINQSQVIEGLVAKAPPLGPRPEVKQAVTGYVAGYNRFLADTGVDRLADPTCRGKPWVRPITEADVYRRFYQLASLASAGVAIDGIGGAAPLVPGPGMLGGTFADLKERLNGLGGLGSNAYGLGRDATDNGRGMVLGNPHFPWQGSERLYQSQLTVPGKMDVAGASLYGVPIVLIGATRGLAWSHTVSTARRFTPFEEKLVPGSPTSYLSDGQVKAMEATTVTVQALGAGGRLEPRTRTLYATQHGPIFTSLLGLPLFPWTPTSAYALGDANAQNFRYLNHFFEVNQAQSVAELDAIEKRNEGIPWVNTIAADAAGNAYYADIGAVPNVSNAKAADCSTALGAQTLPLLGVAILDGSRAACNWGSDPDAVAPGIFGPRNLPSLTRSDYTHNGNDSYWLTNPAQPLEGFARIIGDERTARSLRTRLGVLMVQQRLAGTDGRPGRRFTLDQLQDTVFNNRQYAGELLRDPLVAQCRSTPTMNGSSGPVDVSAACPVLAAWNLRDDLDSRGAVLFRRFASRLLASVGGVVSPPGVFAAPFNAGDPVNTPAGLNTSNPQVNQALADAVKELRDNGIPLDARLREYQYEKRGEERIPIHGGPGGLGVFNAISAPFAGRAGFPDVNHGSSFVMAAQLTGGCPKLRTIVSYSQSENPASPYAADQTRMYSRKEWNDARFCTEDLLRGALNVTELGCYASAGFRSAAIRPRGRGLRFAFSRALALPVRAEVFRVAGRTTFRPRRIASFVRTGSFTYAPRRALPNGVYFAQLTAREPTGRADRRTVAFRVRGGRVTLLPAFTRRLGCRLLRDVALGGPAFGTTMSVGLRVGDRALVTVELRRGRRLVRTVRRTIAGGRFARISVPGRNLAPGSYTVRVRARAGSRSALTSLRALRYSPA